MNTKARLVLIALLAGMLMAAAAAPPPGIHPLPAAALAQDTTETDTTEADTMTVRLIVHIDSLGLMGNRLEVDSLVRRSVRRAMRYIDSLHLYFPGPRARLQPPPRAHGMAVRPDSTGIQVFLLDDTPRLWTQFDADSLLMLHRRMAQSPLFDSLRVMLQQMAEQPWVDSLITYYRRHADSLRLQMHRLLEADSLTGMRLRLQDRRHFGAALTLQQEADLMVQQAERLRRRARALERRAGRLRPDAPEQADTLTEEGALLEEQSRQLREQARALREQARALRRERR